MLLLRIQTFVIRRHLVRSLHPGVGASVVLRRCALGPVAGETDVQFIVLVIPPSPSRPSRCQRLATFCAVCGGMTHVRLKRENRPHFRSMKSRQTVRSRVIDRTTERLLVTLRAKLSGTVYCNRSCLWFVCLCVCGSVTTVTRNCVHRSSPNWVCR